jgi:hypothetical protein
MRDVALVGPAALGVRRERHVQHPARRRVTAYPQLAVGAYVGKALVKRTEPAVVDVPRVPPIPQEQPERRGVAGEDRDVHVLMVTRHPGERLDAPAADDPPGPVEPVHEVPDRVGRERVEAAVPAHEPVVVEMVRGGRGR